MKKLALVMLAAFSSAALADNSLNLEGSGTGNNSTLNVSGSAADISIWQVGSGDNSAAAEKNQISVNVSGSNASTAHLGQGKYWDGSAWNDSAATKGNSMAVTMTKGDVTVHQSSDNNSATVNSDSTGAVVLNQGYRANGGGGGSGFSATIDQQGTGSVTVNQGNAADSTATSGSLEVIHAGSHTVNIAQDNVNGASAGTVKTNTSGNGGSLDITHSNSGNTYVNAAGNAANASAATITGTAVLANDGIGTLALKNATGVVKAFVDGDGSMTIDNLGSSNNVYVNAEGTSAGTTKVTNAGTLVLNQGLGTVGNTLKVTSYTGGTTTVNQLGNYSTLALSGGATTGVATINQTGEYQNATVVSANNTSGTFNLASSGSSLANMAHVSLTY